MEDKNKPPLNSVLRQKAEEILQKRAIITIENYTDVEILKLINELEIHQIEIEVQNDALNSLMNKAEIEAEKYTNLYDLAPFGYFTITKKEEILELNIRAAALLGRERSQLLNKRFAYFIADQSKPTFFLFLEKIFESKTSQTCEIVLLEHSKIPAHVFLTGVLNGDSDQCLLTMVDISALKDSEKALNKSKLLLQSTIESQTDTIILSIDKDYNYLSFNKAHSDSMKQTYNTDVKVGMNILDCISSIEDRKVAKENYDRALNGESHTNIRFYGVAEKAPFESFFNPIVDQDNNIIGATALARNITNRIQDENNLKISEENLQSIFNSVSDAIYVIDKNGNYIDVNKSAENIYMCSREELIGKSWKIFAAPGLNDFDELDKLSQSIFASGKSSTFEFWAVRKNGEIFPKEIIVNRGKYLGETVVIASARDITERHKIENSLQKSQEKLQGIFNVANAGIFLLDQFGNFLMFNDWFCKSLGYTRDEFQELDIEAVSHPEDLEKSYVLNQKVINCEIDKYQIEKRYVRKDKSIMWCEVSASAIKDQNENVVNIIKLVYDISDKILNRKALEKSESRLIEAQSLAKVGNWETDFSFTDANWSDEAGKILGLNSNNIISPLDSVLAIIHPDDRLLVQTVFVHSIKNDTINAFEHRIITPEGIEKIIEQRWKIVRNKQGQPIRAIGTCHDITERKQAEKLIVQSKIRFSSIINSSPVAMALHDENLNITYLNQAFYDMFGYTIAEIPTVHDWFPKAYPNLEYRKKVTKAWDNAFETAKQTEEDFAPMEVIVRCKDGSNKTVMVSATKLLHSYNSEYLINFYDITAQKQAEQALIAEKRRLALILIGTGAGTWEWNILSKELTVNERWAELIGYTIKELGPISFDTWRKYTHPDDAKLTEKIIEKYFQGSLDYYESEFRMKHKNGDWVWILSRGKINKSDLNGEPLLMSGTHLDITERKLATEQLIASESILKQTQMRAKLGSYTLDFTTKKWTSSTVLDSIFGIDIDFEKNMETWNSLLHPDWITIVNEYVSIEVIGKRNNFNKEYKIITLDNKEERWVHTLGEIFLDEEGNPLLLIGSVQDITERKAIEEKLKLTSEKFQELVNSTGGIVWEADAETYNFTFVSNQAERLLGYATEEWYGNGFWAKHLHPEDKQNAVDYCLSHTKKLENHDFTYRFIAKNGDVIWLRDIVNVIVENGKPRWLRGVIFDETYLKETNLLLSESEEKYRGLVENAPYGIIIYVAEKITFINDEGFRMLGAKNKAEIIGASVFQFVHPDNVTNIAQRMKDVTRNKNASALIEEQFIKIDGTPFDAELKAIPSLYEHLPAVQIIFQDVTQKRQSASELNKINRVYALISQINNLIIRTHNREELFQEICNIAVHFGKFRLSWIGFLNGDNTISTAAFAGFENGYFAERAITSFSDVQEKRGPTRIALQEGRAIICNDIAHDAIMEPFHKEALQRGYNSMMSIPILVRNKYVAAFNLYSDEKNFFSSDEEIYLLEKITLNIAFALETILTEEERKQNEQKIRQLSQAVEQSPVTVIITDITGNIEYVNPKFTETTGYTLEEVIGKNTRFLKSNHMTADEFKKLWETINAGNNWKGEFYNKSKNGDLYWESSTISPLLNDQGVTTHYIAINENITNRKIAEQELIDAKLKAEESDRLKLAFLANMSHEIRTPMNGILGFTELLKAPDLSGKEQNEFISIIEKSGQRMLNIINDIINISKVEAGQIEVTLSETNVNDQLNYIYSFFTPEANQKGIQLVIKKQLPEKYNLLLTDNEKLYAVLTNLVKNAVKFTNQGSIEFGCEKIGANISFFVKDTGIGISDSQKSIVFERFRQASESVCRSHEGSGLGLAISKAYIEKLGGKIWVDSEKGKGSTFHFTIPSQSEPENELKNECKDNSKPTKENLQMQQENKIKDLKVLIVEDDPISKLLLTFVIKSFSKEIIKVSSGIEAIEACINNPDIDLIMMDANMPKMGGYEATRQIREFNKDVVIIAQTANALNSDRNDAIQAGCTDYISKPINSADLKTLIQKYFKK